MTNSQNRRRSAFDPNQICKGSKPPYMETQRMGSGSTNFQAAFTERLGNQTRP